ncbi:MAG: hypothetical protein H7250_09545 [Flavobacterium sp.]|nr:hypothetical protein [Flavobacterium sp.]
MYFELSKENIDETRKDSLISNLFFIQKEIETSHFQYFKDIKKICKFNQIEGFKNLTENLTVILSRKFIPD